MTALFNYTRAARLLKMGLYEDAIPAFSLVIRQMPELAEGYRGRAVAEFHEGRLVVALEDFNQAIALKDDYADAYKERAILYIEMGEPELARSDLERALTHYDPLRDSQDIVETISLLDGL